MQGLQLRYLYHDVDIIQVRVTVENGRFRGTADIYVARGELLDLAKALANFPATATDEREIILGSFSSHRGGGIRLQFYVKDLAQHAALRATIEDDRHGATRTQSATLLLDFEPPALDRFLDQATHIERELTGTAALATQPHTAAS